jgi:hypothetical protein
MRAESPTVTTIRVRGAMTGALTAMIEAKDNFGGENVQEDSVFVQMRERTARLNLPRDKVVIIGDITWVRLFGD